LHLPVVGAIAPGPVQFVGSIAAVLLLARYLIVKEDDIADDFELLASSLPRELPVDAESLSDTLVPLGTAASKIVDGVSSVNPEEISDSLQDAPEKLPKWFGDLENPVVDLGGPIAAVAGAVVLGNVANWPILGVFAPRALELLGAGVIVYALERYGSTDADVKEDLESVVDESKRALKKFF